MRVLILGAGGHAQVVVDILLRMREAGADLTPLGYLDDDPALIGERFLDLPVLGRTVDLPTIRHRPQPHSPETIRGAAMSGGELFHRPPPQCRHRPRRPDRPRVYDLCQRGGQHRQPHRRQRHPQHRLHRRPSQPHVAPGVHLGGEVTVGQGALIGIGASVMPGRSVGAGTVVGAGAVVTRDLPAGVTAVGVPARVMKKGQLGQAQPVTRE